MTNDHASDDSSSSRRITINLMINVETVRVDLTVGILHVKGRVCRENDHVNMGAYHTIDIPMHHHVKIFKDPWDSVSFSLVNEAIDLENKAEIAAVIFQLGI